MGKQNKPLRDKYKSTKTIYPKINSDSITNEVITEITRITEVVVEEQVVPNPTPTGTPTELQYITINGNEYYIKEGTLVIANPTLAGTEGDLTGIQIGDVKYKIPSGGSAQVQANWNETDTDSPAYIQNKPTIPAAQVQSNWNETDTDSPAYIKNKPTIPHIYLHSFMISFQDTSNSYFFRVYGIIYNNNNNDVDLSAIKTYILSMTRGTLASAEGNLGVSGYRYCSTNQEYKFITQLHVNETSNNLVYSGEVTGGIDNAELVAIRDWKLQLI